MKSKLYIVLLLFSISFFAQQLKKDQGILFGLKGGLNISNFTGDIENNKSRTSVHLGLLSEIIISDNFSLQPELLYSSQGYSDKSLTGFNKIRYDYINLPVIAKIYIGKKLSVDSGVQAGFLISARKQMDNSITKIDNQKLIDLGLNIGVSYQLENGVFFQTRYNMGLNNINKPDNRNYFEYNNSVMQFSTGIIFK